jgi:membrane-associated phospholipid phosphatase
MKWTEFYRIKKLRTEFLLTIILLAATLFTLAHFLDFVELRQGVVLPDPILDLFQPINLTWLTFGLIYCSLVLAIILLFKNPERLMFAIQVYIAFVIVRISAMYLVPLNPPEHMIQLSDPFVQFFGTGKLLTKDLFFSGHTATLFILFLVTEKKYFKYFFLTATIIVGLSVLLQHVHYSIDVFAAPFFTYACYKIVLIYNLKRGRFFRN